MNIGIVTTWYERGAAYVSRQYQQILEQAGNTVFIFARDGEYAKGDPVWDQPNVHWARTWPVTDASRMQVGDFRRWLRRKKIDLVIFNEQRMLWPIAVCQRLGIRTVAYIDYYRATSVKHFACYDGLICNTKRHFSVFSWHPGALYLPWGTDTELFAPQGKQDTWVQEGVLTFFHSAGCSDRKGTDFLIQAFARTSGKARLIIHTQKDLLVWFPDCAELIHDLQTQGRLEIINRTVTAPGLYHLGDVYVYPTKLEGIGLTICEAMSCGLPAIVPDNGPMNEFVEDGKTGLLVQVESYRSRADGYYWPMSIVSTASLQEKMQFCIDNPEWVFGAKQQARTAALTLRDWASNSHALYQHLSDLPKNGKSLAFASFSRRMLNTVRHLNEV